MQYPVPVGPWLHTPLEEQVQVLLHVAPKVPVVQEVQAVSTQAASTVVASRPTQRTIIKATRVTRVIMSLHYTALENEDIQHVTEETPNSSTQMVPQMERC